MYCVKCGFQNKENAMYCQNCGAPIRQKTAEQSPYRNTGGGDLSDAFRMLVLSPVFMVAVVALSTQIVISVLVAATGYSPFARIAYAVLENADIPYYYLDSVYQAVGMLNKTNVGSVILSNLSAIVIAAGLWILYANARNPMRRIETVGLTMIQVVIIIQMVLLGLILLVGLIAVIVSISVASRMFDTSPGIGIFFTLIIEGTIGFFVFFYYIRILRMINSAKNIVVMGNRTFQASMFVIILTFIGGGFQCISAFSSVFMGALPGFLTQAASASATISFGLLMLRFNSLEMMQASNTSSGIESGKNLTGNGSEQYSGFSVSPEQPMPSVIPSYIPPKKGTVVLETYEDDEKKKRYAKEGTMVLNDEPAMPQAKLIRSRDGMEIRITKPNFTIGKAYGNVDFFIEGNPAISRQHAEIVFHDDSFYIIDTKSTNHVYVDGMIIPAEKPVPIRSGMKIRLADEVYEFSEGR